MRFLGQFGKIVIFSICMAAPQLSALSSSGSVRKQPIGRITSLDRSKIDGANDSKFYSQPNLVTHTDDSFIQKIKSVYREEIADNSVILDMCSSHVSHLPESLSCQRVDVHGMNAEELELNEARALTGGFSYVRNLNDNPSFVGLCDVDGQYDSVLCCVGVQYLEEPEAVFAEVSRILKPGTGKVIVSFTNRFFFQKALQGWINRGMKERANLVRDYLRAAGGFDNIRILGDGTGILTQLMSLGGIGGDPFVAVVATRSKDLQDHHIKFLTDTEEVEITTTNTATEVLEPLVRVAKMLKGVAFDRELCSHQFRRI